MQSLLGKLLNLHKCVKPALLFVNRILASFRQNTHRNQFPTSVEMKPDIHWSLFKKVQLGNPILYTLMPHTWA